MSNPPSSCGPCEPDYRRPYGYPDAVLDRETQIKYAIPLMIAAHSQGGQGGPLLPFATDLINAYREKSRLLEQSLPPVFQRIQDFLDDHLKDTGVKVDMPRHTLVLPAHGIARTLSFPANADTVELPYVTSYRVLQGVLHNPRSDKRTTKGVFHITEGSVPISDDKLVIPKGTFARIVKAALNPPEETMWLPFTLGGDRDRAVPAEVSLLLRPIVCPDVPGHVPEKNMEVLCLAPGTLVSNLDFLESVFGNAGDASLPENDAALDVVHWTGHTGCIIHAPHVCLMTKKDLGLPRWEDATEQQRAQGMCWKDASEKYNDGSAFKAVCRTSKGVIVTVIADNYFGYSKKEVKSQISFAANLAGVYEEQHSGGCWAFARHSHGLEYDAQAQDAELKKFSGYTLDQSAKLLGGNIKILPDGYGVDTIHPDVVYVPETAHFSVLAHSVSWPTPAGKKSIKLEPSKVYILPNGFKIQMEKHPAEPSWRLLATEPGCLCMHKPCTVSGGGKSELSKSLSGCMLYGPMFVSHPTEDFAMIDSILNYADYHKRFKSGVVEDRRPVLSKERSLGSVIKMLTPNVDYTDEYNEWLRKFPMHVWPIVYHVKRFYRDEWKGDWRSHFGMDLINSHPGNMLKFDGRKITAGYLKVGATETGSWYTYKTRTDFIPCVKVQQEDDISACITIPKGWITHLHPEAGSPPSYKLASNCEFRLFQRPDDCIFRGRDEQCEADLALPGNFIANYEPLMKKDAEDIVADVISFEEYTAPMQEFIKKAAKSDSPKYFVSSSFTRLVNGKPTANPRYLQMRPDVAEPVMKYTSEVGYKLFYKLPLTQQVAVPIDVMLFGRRISKPQAGLPNLAIYNPLHYQELPEYLMDIICGMSGTSPSTTGAGSEGALTKGPFNSLPFTVDLGNLLVSCLLTGLGGWSTPTGQIGPKLWFGHDISMIFPEVFTRMKPQERDPAFLIKNGFLEKMQDFQYEGKTVLASRLGYRITAKFSHFLSRVFDYPLIFVENVLKPEIQSMPGFVNGVEELVTAHRVIAEKYFRDRTVELACPPLKALLHIMAHGNYNGKTLGDPEVRKMFSREYVESSDWYLERLRKQQQLDKALWSRHIAFLTQYINTAKNACVAERLGLKGRLEYCAKALEKVSIPTDDYVKAMRGTIGVDHLIPQV